MRERKPWASRKFKTQVEGSGRRRKKKETKEGRKRGRLEKGREVRKKEGEREEHCQCCMLMTEQPPFSLPTYLPPSQSTSILPYLTPYLPLTLRTPWGGMGKNREGGGEERKGLGVFVEGWEVLDI